MRSRSPSKLRTQSTRCLLSHVAHEHDRHAALLGGPHQPARHLAHLAHGAGRAGKRRVVEDLDRVDHAYLGALGLDRRDHAVGVCLGHHRHPQRGLAQPLRPQPDLGGRLLARHVQDAAAGGREVAEGGARDRGLADPWRAADEHQRARDQAAAEDPVELAYAGGEPRDRGRLDLTQRHRPQGTCRLAGRARRCRPRLLDDRVPLAAAGAAPVPLRGLVTAGGAEEDRGGTCHVPRLRTRVDGLAPAGELYDADRADRQGVGPGCERRWLAGRGRRRGRRCG